MGITAYPVLFSTRKNGKIKEKYPSDQSFNYVSILAVVDGKNILTDATEYFNSNNLIPVQCMNGRGLLIQKERVEWVELQSVHSSLKQTEIDIHLSTNLQRSDVEMTATDYYAMEYRKNPETNGRTLQKQGNQKMYQVEDSSLIIKNQTNVNEPYILKYTAINKLEILNNKIYISPFLNENISDKPLKQPNRNGPIDLIYSTKNSFFSEMNIPDGYKVDYFPEHEKIKNDEFEFDYTTAVNENKIQVTFVYYFKLPVYPAGDYAKIKYYYK